ncbi:uncharacterized protein LOC144568692 [Carex rostrata]
MRHYEVPAISCHRENMKSTQEIKAILMVSGSRPAMASKREIRRQDLGFFDNIIGNIFGDDLEAAAAAPAPATRREGEKKAETMKGGRFFNPRVASHHFGSLSAKVGNSEPSVGIMIAEADRLNVAFSYLGRLLKKGHRAGTGIFNPILKRLCYENRIGEAAAIVTQKMPQLGCIPDVETYNSLKDGFCKKGEIEKAEKMLHNIISKELQPNVVTYNNLIYGLCNIGEIEKAEEVLHNMISKRIKPNVVTYNSLIYGLCNKGEIEKAEEVLHSMISKRIKPNVMTYNNLIHGLCKKGETEKAEEVLHSMISKRIKPNVFTYYPLIGGLCKKGEIEKAKVLLHSMISEGIEPDDRTYLTLIDELAQA